MDNINIDTNIIVVVYLYTMYVFIITDLEKTCF
jgi:hypothetical protein